MKKANKEYRQLVSTLQCAINNLKSAGNSLFLSSLLTSLIVSAFFFSENFRHCLNFFGS